MSNSNQLVQKLWNQFEAGYRHLLESLGRQPGTLGRGLPQGPEPQPGPGQTRRLVVNLINEETWTSVVAALKGGASEGLLQKGAEDTKSDAGQYFTPRAMIACPTPARRDGRRPAKR